MGVSFLRLSAQIILNHQKPTEEPDLSEYSVEVADAGTQRSLYYPTQRCQCRAESAGYPKCYRDPEERPAQRSYRGEKGAEEGGLGDNEGNGKVSLA